MYEIIKCAAPVPPVSRKSAERLTMEELEVGDAFMVDNHEAQARCVWARVELRPKKFSIRKVPNKGWLVRREQ